VWVPLAAIRQRGRATPRGYQDFWGWPDRDRWGDN